MDKTTVGEGCGGGAAKVTNLQEEAAARDHEAPR